MVSMTVKTLPFVVALTLTQVAPAPMPAPPAAKEIAPDTFLLPGAMLPNRGPDGNTVVIAGPSGLIAIDTGRHTWQSDGILAFAREKRQPVVAIVNTHWHLDHSSGNGRVKAVYPQAKTYTTRAVDRALAPGGFLVRSLESVRAQAKDPNLPEARRQETQIFLTTMETPDILRPDVPVERSGAMTLAGRPLSMRVATDAVTDADLWIYDEATNVAVIGDLVTLPAPFFETACPKQWQTALDDVWATSFRIAVPGHGPVMSRADFDTYRKAFGNFRTCVRSDSAPAACAAGWANDLGTLLGTDDDRRQATGFASYYVDFLRKGGGASPDCRVRG